MRTRVLTAAVAIPIVLAASFISSPWPLFVLACVATAIGSYELGALTAGSRRTYPILGLAAMALLGGFLSGAFPGWTTSDFMIRNAGLLLAGYFGAGLLLTGMATRLASEAAALWIAAPLASLVLLKVAVAPAAGQVWTWQSPLLMVFVPLWAGDTAALLVGRAIGKHKLVPKVSPNKTIEGAIGNLVASIFVAWGIGAWLGYSPSTSVLCGLSIGVLGQIGDLFESALKRSAEKKDSGGLLPGHGGLLDRIDSLLLAAPAVSALLVFGSGTHPGSPH